MKIVEYSKVGGRRPQKPKSRRNFVAKNAPTTGAGGHRDKKNDYKRRDKHRKSYESDDQGI